MALDPNGIAAGRPGRVYPGGWWWRRGWLRDDDSGGRLFFRGVKRAALVIEVVANGSAQGGTGDTADDRSARGVTLATVVADDGASEGAHGRTADGALLGVGSDPDAAGEKRGDTKYAEDRKRGFHRAH